MFTLNTKQVRALANPIANRSAKYTDRTQKGKANKHSTRRSVVYMFYNPAEADALYTALKRTGMQNVIKRTSTTGNMWTHTSGGEYVRIIADIS